MSPSQVTKVLRVAVTTRATEANSGVAYRRVVAERSAEIERGSSVSVRHSLQPAIRRRTEHLLPALKVFGREAICIEWSSAMRLALANSRALCSLDFLKRCLKPCSTRSQDRLFSCAPVKSRIRPKMQGSGAARVDSALVYGRNDVPTCYLLQGTWD